MDDGAGDVSARGRKACLPLRECSFSKASNPRNANIAIAQINSIAVIVCTHRCFMNVFIFI